MAQKPEKTVSKLTHIKMFGQNRTQQPQKTDHYQFDEEVEIAKNQAVETAKFEESQPQLPTFLQNVHQPADLVEDTDLQEFKPKENRILDFGYLGSSSKEVNPNSFSSIFSKDHAEQTGVQRVFRKSVAFLVAQSLLFATLILAGINLFQLNILIILIIAVAFVVATNIFYIILADKSYVWLSLATQAVFLLLINSFIGQGFSIPTLLFTTVTLLLSYIAYTEVEKFQLGARLFKISIITGESTRMMINVTSIVLALGVFNGIASYGSQAFVDNTVLKNETVNTFVFDGIGGFGLNSGFIKFHKYFQSAPQGARFYDFLEENYRTGEELGLKTDENTVTECVDTDAANDTICDERVQQIRYERAQKWADERYPTITFPVQTELTPERYDQIVKEHYSQLVKNFVSENNASTKQNIPIPVPSFVPRESLVPAVTAIIVYLLLFIAGFVLRFIAYLATLAVWKILQLTNFVNLDVENVEAEVVSI